MRARTGRRVPGKHAEFRPRRAALRAEPQGGGPAFAFPPGGPGRVLIAYAVQGEISHAFRFGKSQQVPVENPGQALHAQLFQGKVGPRAREQQQGKAGNGLADQALEKGVELGKGRKMPVVQNEQEGPGRGRAFSRGSFPAGSGRAA